MNFLKKTFLSIGLILCSFSFYAQRSYKELMKDNTVNFYEVCAVADAYFETIEKEAKGSGWMGYQRWKYDNEMKYYPSGDRSISDPYLVSKAYEEFLANYPMEKALFPTGWNEVGPITIDSITGHYAPGLGRVECFYVNPDDDDIMYFGSRSGGFWSSTNGGETWNGGSTDFLFASGVNTMTISPTNPDSILINLRNADNGVTHGIYRSTNGGMSWTMTNYNPVILGKGGLGSTFAVNQIAFHPTIPNLVFVAASDGLYRSTDNLSTWVKITTGSISEIEFHPTNPNIIYIYDYYYWGANKNKVLRSTNMGVTFSGSAEIVGNANNTNVHLDTSPICPDCVYFASGNGLWKSFNSGLTFSFVSNPAISSEGFAVSDVDTSKMTYGGIDAFASSNGGASFIQVTWWGLWAAPFDGDQYIHADMRSAECISGNFYMATDGYFARSTDNGTTWERLCDDVGIRENYTLGVSQSNHYQTIVGSQDNGTSIKLQEGWIEFAGADGMEGIIHPLNEDWMISSYQYGGRRRTLDRGLNQSNVTPPGHSSQWVAPMAYDPNEHMRVYHFGVDVHRSDNYGASWVVTGSPSFSGDIDEAAIAENNTNIIVVSNGQDIERSLDGGVTWVDIQGSLPGYGISDIAFDPLRDSTFIVTYNRYNDDGSKVYITHDLGNTWSNITSNLNKMPIHGAVIDHSYQSYIYLAAEIGVYVKAMDEPNWVLYNADLPNCSVLELEIVNGSNTLRAATWGRGVWEYHLKNRKFYPAIVNTTITDPPTLTVPAEESNQYVTSVISSDFDLDEVYVKWSIDAPTFENTIVMENIVDSTWVSETPLPDFPAGTKVFFKVFAKDEAAQLSETYKFMYTVQPFEYCDSYGTMSYGTSVTRVEFSDLTNISGKPAGYTSYLDADTATIYRTMPYDLSMKLNTDGPYTIHARAWLDWNRDGDFSDLGESYDLGTAYNTADGITTLSPLTIFIPDYAHLGKTTMRVSAKYNSDPSACETGFDGEVEDYTIFIKPLVDVDMSIAEDEICFGEKIYFTYNGTPLDSVFWSFTNGIDTYTSENLIDSILVESAGEYNLTLIGWEGELFDASTYPDVLVVHQVYETTDVQTICEGTNYSFGTQTLTEAGFYTEPFESIYGCDSIVNLTLGITSVDVSVSAATFELTANLPDASYQWLDCNDAWAEVPGAINQIFEPLANGSYAVVVTNEGCSDTSDCYDIVALDLNENAEFPVIVYPNPSDGNFTLQLPSFVADLQLAIYDVSGKVVYESTYNNTSKIDLKLDLASGTYYVRFLGLDNDGIIIKLAIKQ